MEPLTFHDGRVELYAEDCLAVLKLMPDCFVDAVITDPPYHLTSIVKRFGSENAAPAKGNEAFVRASRGFMGQQWDGGDIAFRPDVWRECLRVLKPGGHLASFSGTRTYHRMACAIEDAGFEIRDQLAWTYGSGFPKSHDVSKGIDKAAGAEREVVGVRTDGRGASPQKLDNHGRGDTGIGHADGSKQTYNETAPATDAAREWQGWGTALKPAWEPICLARKPLSEGTVAANVLRWGTGAINVDACRVGIDEQERSMIDARSGAGFGTIQCEHAGRSEGERFKSHSQGRFPANLVHDGSPEVLAGLGPSGRFFSCFPTEPDTCTHSNANDAAATFSLASERAVSALSRAAEASTPRLALLPQSYQAHDTNVSAQLFDGLATLLTGAILNIEKRFSRGLPPERLSLSDSRASVAATPRPTGTISITISLSTLSGFAEAVTFDLIETRSEAGAADFANRFYYVAKANKHDRAGSNHPTVKPISLIAWLVRMLTPPGGLVLDPFAGTGTLAAATFQENKRAILIEREELYRSDIVRRVEALAA